MITIKVCVGSSCHLKGSYNVIEAFKGILKKYDVEDLVELQASFCLGNCSRGVTVQCEAPDTMLLHNVSAENAEELFVAQVYPLIQK